MISTISGEYTRLSHPPVFSIRAARSDLIVSGHEVGAEAGWIAASASAMFQMRLAQAQWSGGIPRCWPHASRSERSSPM